MLTCRRSIHPDTDHRAGRCCKHKNEHDKLNGCRLAISNLKTSMNVPPPKHVMAIVEICMTAADQHRVRAF